MSIQPPSNIQTPPPSQLPQQPVKKSNKGLIIAIIAIVIVLGAGAAYYFLVYSKDDAGDNSNKVVVVNNVNSEVNTNVSNTNVNTATNTNINSAVNSNTNTTSVSNLNVSITNNNSESSESTTKIVDGQTVDWPDYLSGDEDGDDVVNGLERTYGTDLNLKDSDGDGFDDKVEIGSCYNPTSEGKMDGQYFSEIYCAIDSSQIVDVVGESMEQKNFLINKHNELCKDWTIFADEVINSKIAGENIGLLFTLENENYSESCSKIQDKYSSGQLDDIITKFAFSASNAEELCDEFSYKIRLMC